MVILDRIGCGKENKTREEIESDIERKLFRSGWADRACAVAIDPELENWIWVNEPRISGAISWESETGIYEWLHNKNWKEEGSLKPAQPKEAFETLLRQCRMPRSSSIYRDIAERASYDHCQDPAFRKMLGQLKNWLE